MEKELELVVVQLDECRRLMQLGTAPYLRIALLLADNAAEIIMAEKIASELLFNNERAMLIKDAFGRRPGYWSDEQIEDAKRRYISPKMRRNIERNFDAKVDVLVSLGYLVNELGSGLKWLHRYRNEAYHRAELRTRVLRPAVRVYFEMCCDLLEGYYEPGPGFWQLWSQDEFAKAFPHLAAFGPLELGDGEPLIGAGSSSAVPATIADVLRKGVDSDFEGLKADLMDHLLLRVEEIDKTLTTAYESLLYGEGWTRADVFRFAQLADVPDVPYSLSLERARSRKYRYKLSDLDRWKKEAGRLNEKTDRNSLLADFAKIEEDLEPCYKLVYEAMIELDRILQDAFDVARGK